MGERTWTNVRAVIKMVLHLLGVDQGRNAYRRVSVTVQLLVAAWGVYRFRPGPSGLVSRLWGALAPVAPGTTVLGMMWLMYFMRNVTLLLGLNAPRTSLRTGPDKLYSPSFSRVRWILTALDAGVLSTYKIGWAPLRNTLSILLGALYLIFSRKAEIKVRSFQQVIDHDMIRACWQKGRHPVLRLVRDFEMPQLPTRREVFFARPESDGGGQVRALLLYNGPESDLRDESLQASRKLVLSFPGGGFVAMNPEDHEDYLSVWAKELKVPILTVDYRKAPEDPYPAGLNDCWQVYNQLVATGGSSIFGGSSPLEIVLVGDSAGGNLVAAVTMMAIDKPGMQRPIGVHMIYPALNLDMWLWTDGPRPVHNVTGSSMADETNGQSMASIVRFMLDGVLPMTYMRHIGVSYLGSPPSHNPRDWHVSPVFAPEHLLKEFPDTYIHAGSSDPLIDDSLSFMHKLQLHGQADPKLHVFPGVSHAYMHVTGLLPEAKEAMALSMSWISQLLNLDNCDLQQPVNASNIAKL